MSASFLSRRPLFGVPNALLILLVVFFLIPFGVRGARLSLGKTENNVKDWLPSDFRETSELEWFGRYFAGERFILATWEGCNRDDQRLQLLLSKLTRESAAGRAGVENLADFERVQKLADELGLMLPSDLHRNWGGENEIWLTSTEGFWYYLKPDGQLFRWTGRSDTVGGTWRGLLRTFRGPYVEGKFITAVGQAEPSGVAGPKINPYYNNPSLLTVPLFATVQSGPQVVEQLSKPGGAFYPVDTTAEQYKEVIARRRATKQLTGTLFASAIPENFGWTPEAFRQAIPAEQRDELPEFFDETVAETLDQAIEEKFGGSFDALLAATDDEQTDVWYAVFDQTGVEPPPRLTGLLLTLTKVGQEHLPYVVGRGALGMPRGRLYVLAKESGLSPPPAPIMLPPPLNRLVSVPPPTGPELHVGGPPIDNVSIDEEGTITLVRLVGYCAALGLFLSYMCFRSLKITMMIFFVGVTSAAASLSLVWWSGSGVDAILMSMPSLVYVLGLSSAIHIVNYYREEVESGGVAGAPERALAHGWGPCTLASLTTAIGLLSLYTSNIIPIRKFGWFSALGVVATLAILFTYLPAALEVFVPAISKSSERRKKSNDRRNARRQRRGKPEKVGVGVLADRWETFGRWVVNHHRLVSIACLAVFVLSAIGLPKIQTSVQLLKLFGDNSRIIQDYTWLEKHYAKLVPMELVLRVPPEMQAGATSDQEPTDEEPTESDTAVAGAARPRFQQSLTMLERFEAVDHIQKTIARAFGSAGKDIVGQAMSAAALAPPLPEPDTGFSLRRRTFNKQLSGKVQDLIDSDYLRIEDEGALQGSELWRISLRVGALGDTDYGVFVNELRVAVNPVLEAYRYRQQILDVFNAEESEKPIVLVLGRDAPQSVGVEPVLIDPVVSRDAVANGPAIDGNGAADLVDAEIDVHSVFASVLRELLANEAIRGQDWRAAPGVDDQGNPTGRPVSQRLLEAADVVVLVDGAEGFDLDFVRQHAKHVVNAADISAERARPEVVDGIPVLADSGPLQVVYTGVVPVVYKAQRTLLASLVESIAWAFVLIAAVMVILLNPGRPLFGMLRPTAVLFGVGAGLVAMLPNVFPVVVIFGSMGHMGTLVDIGTMMTASVAMGVAVDDTIHFLSWLRRGLDDGLSRHDALIQTYRRVGPAMTQTTIVGGLGLFVFALSTFTPTQRFGTLMLVLLGAALVGDLVFLPALLAGPLGKLFRPRPHAAHRGPATPSGDHVLGSDPQQPASDNGDGVRSPQDAPGQPTGDPARRGPGAGGPPSPHHGLSASTRSGRETS
jgi:predicted RND superfamily exporter protein